MSPFKQKKKDANLKNYNISSKNQKSLEGRYFCKNSGKGANGNLFLIKVNNIR